MGTDEQETEAERVGRAVHRSDWLDRAIRFGLVVYGLVYVALGWLAVQLATGDYDGSVTHDGALKQLAGEPFGRTLLLVAAFGMVLLVGWRLLDAAFGHREKQGGDRWRKRAADVGKAAIYGTVAWSAVDTAFSSPSESASGAEESRALTARLMDLPLGQWVVAGVGVGVLVYGGFHVWRGLGRKHRKDLAAEGRAGTAGPAYLLLGSVGHVAKGFAFAMVGALFVQGAVTHDPSRSSGLDGALREVLEKPYGGWLLGALGLGLGCYGVFQLVRARHLSR